MVPDATRTVAITGAAGFLGRRVVDAARREGLETIPLDSSVDVRRLDPLLEAVQDCDAIIHLAAVVGGDALESGRTNVAGTLNVLEVARRQGASVVLASSLAADRASDPYGLSKRHAEEWCRLHHERHGTPVAILRFASLYGEGARWNSLQELARSNPVRVSGDGSQERDYLHVDDAAEAAVSALSVNECVRTDVGTGDGIAIREIAEWLDRPVVYEPEEPTGPAVVVAEPPKIPWRPKRSSHESLKSYVSQLAREHEPVAPEDQA